MPLKGLPIPRVSIRAVLFAVLLVLGGWGLALSFQSMDADLAECRASRELSTNSLAANQLLVAAQYLAFERGRTLTLLREPRPATDADRMFLDERRRLGGAALAAAAGHLQAGHRPEGADLAARMERVGRLRPEVDQALDRPGPGRPGDLPRRWLEAADALVDGLRATIGELIGATGAGQPPSRLNLLAHAAFELRLIAGAEANLVGAVASGTGRPEADRERILTLRGREDQLWEATRRLAAEAGEGDLQGQVEGMFIRHLHLARPVQDRLLAGGRVSPGDLKAYSLPLLDGIAGLAVVATNRAVFLADRGLERSRRHLLRSLAWQAGLLAVMLFACGFVVFKVIRPLERVDRELARLGALPAPLTRTGNEVDRIAASVVALETSLAQRARAEAEREATIRELQAALEQIRALRGILPICAHCKKIRNDRGYWEQVESYLATHLEASFTHGYCPDCARLYFPEIAGKLDLGDRA